MGQMKNKGKPKQPAEDPHAVDAEFQKREKPPARGAKKPTEDEQDGDWSGDRDYEVD